MRIRSSKRRNGALLALALAPFFSHSAHAQLTWDASGNSPAAATDGSGTWSKTVANWTDGATNMPWAEEDFAYIGNGGTAGTITIDDPGGSVSAAGIQFNPVASGSYTIAANGLNTLNLVSGASLNFAAGAGAVITAPISGTVGLTTGGGTLGLSGHNAFTGPVQINSGAVTTNTSDGLGDAGNLVSLGTPNTGTSVNDPVAALTVNSFATIGSFKCSTNNALVNTLTVNPAASLTVTPTAGLSGLSSTVNAVFIVGSPNVGVPITTKLTAAGGGSLVVNGGSTNSSFLVGMGNSNSSANTMTFALDMSGLGNFSFTTGTGAVPSTGGNEFAIGHGAGATGVATLATNNTIVAGTITVGDNGITPGLTVTPTPNSPTNPSTLDLGSGNNTFNANNIVIGNVRSQGVMTWAGTTTTGSLTIAGAAGGASTADITIGQFSLGTPPNSASTINLSGHTANVQAGTVILGNFLTGGGNGTAGSGKGGSIVFDTGTFSIVNLEIANASGTGGLANSFINGTLQVGSSGNSTGVLNVTNLFYLGNVQGTNVGAKATLVMRGGTANINTNIVDVSNANTSSNAVTFNGGTLNMNGFAIGLVGGVTGGTRHIATINFPALGNTAAIANLGGTGINDAGLNMNGTGVLVLEGSSTYFGTTTVTSGTLQVGQAADLVAPNSALRPAVTNNSVVAFGSSQNVTSSSVISGTGAVAQNGTGITMLTGNNSYTGPTLLVSGLLSTSSLPNEAAAGGTNSPIGASGNAASNLVLTGGGLQYAGPGGSTDRLFSVTPTGGSIDASGGGAIVFNNGGAIVSADPAPRATTDSATSARVTLPSVADLVAGMTVTGTNIPPGTTILSINPTANSITLSNIPSAAGADTLSFGTANRTLTLTGTNTSANTLGASLSNSAGGGTLSLTKSGSGAWSLTAANSYTGVTTVQGGALTAVGSAAWAPALANSNITGGRLIFDYASDTSPAGTVGPALASSYLTGFSTGPLRSTAANAAKGLGWKDDTGAKKVTVMFTYFGDADLDGQVTTSDFTILGQNFNGAGPWAKGDFNYDGKVNALDFNAIANNFGSPALGAPVLGSLVPEPASLGLFVLMFAPRRRSTSK